MPRSKSRGLPDRFRLERRLAASGVCRVAGVDEAGRGPLAGPVVAAAVILPQEWIREGMPDALAGLNDSKQLTAARREAFYERLLGEAAVVWSVAEVDPETIDRVNILQATHLAMRRALVGLSGEPDHVLVDGLRVDTLPGPQTPVVKGDTLSYSIAAASVVAKVTRDRRMVELDRLHPGYGLAEHKGYGTRRHLEALARLGPSPAHRRSFLPVSQPQLQLFGSGR